MLGTVSSRRGGARHGTSERLEVRTLLAANLVADLWPGAASTPIDDVVPFAGAAYFNVGYHGSDTGPTPGIWRNDGNAAETSLVQAGYFDDLAVSNGQLWFSGRVAGDNDGGSQAFRMSSAGALTQVTHFNNDITTNSSRPQLAPLDGLTVFNAAVMPSGTGPLRYRVFASRGTPQTTVDLGPSGINQPFVRSGPYLYYGVPTETGATLYRTDGTPSGTAPVPGVSVYGALADDPTMADLNGSLLFFGRGTPAGAGEEVFGLWRTGGTTSSAPMLLRPFHPDAASGNSEMALLGGRLFFRATEGPLPGRVRLWATDGTAAGTVPIGTGNDPTNPNNPRVSWPHDMTTHDGAVYFVNGPNANTPSQLWKTDGTEAGTVPLTSIGRPNDFTGARAILGAAGGVLFFAASDGVTGLEPYQTDGTPAGTGRTADIYPGPIGSLSAGTDDVVEVGGKLMFRASHPDTGVELWSADPAAPPTPIGLGSISGTVTDDANANGRRDEGEAPLAGQTVYLDTDSDRTPDPGEPSAVTGPDGRYTIGGLPYGIYDGLRYAPPDLRRSTGSGDGFNYIVLASGEHLDGYDFASTAAGVIDGTVFNDSDLDGVRDAGEPPLEGWTVHLDTYRDGVVFVPGPGRDPTTTTDAAGNFRFAHLVPGDYRVRLVPRQGAHATAPASGYVDVTVAAGQTVGPVDFGAATVADVTGFTLINADTDRPVPGVRLEHGATIDLATTGRRLNVRADVGPGPVESVRFNFDGDPDYRVESSAPYALAGDDGGDYRAWTPALGTHTLVATAYRADGAGSQAGMPRAITFNVVDTSPAAAPVRVNAGGPAYTTRDGKPFAADSGGVFRGGVARRGAFDVAGTDDDPLYRDGRFGRAFGFSRGLPNGVYRLTLHFAEPTFARAGQRVFDVVAENRRLLDDYDVVADAGASRTAVVKSFRVPVTDGRIDVSFRGEVDHAMVSAIEVAPDRAPAEPSPLYANAGGGALVDSLGRRFEADRGFAGGTRGRTASAIAGTDDDAPFATHRAGNSFTFARPVADGDYVLWLQFAEPTATAAGRRTFDVWAEGRQVLDDYDVFADAGAARTATARAFDVTVADGELNLGFRGVAGQAIVSAVVLLPADAPAAALPYTPEAWPEESRRVLTAGRIRQIGLGMQMFASENKGRMPDHLGQVLASAGLTPDVFANPRAGTEVPRGELSAVEASAWARSREGVDYVYTAAGKRLNRLGPNEIILYENPARVPGGIHALFADGHVEFLDRAAAAALIGFDPAPPADPPTFPDPTDPALRPDPLVLQSADHLRRIHQAAYRYARLWWPENLGLLLGTSNPGVEPATFLNPRGDTPPPPPGLTPEQQAAWVNEAADYVYVGAGRRTFQPDAVLAYENPSEMPGGINILFSDGRVEFRELRWAVETIRRDEIARAGQ